MDGLWVKGASFRRLFASDTAAFKQHLLRLDLVSRNDRFGMSVSDSFIEKYVDEFWPGADIAYGCFIGGTLRAVGELRMIKPKSGPVVQGEAAFSVERSWRLAGVGSALMHRILRAANNRNIKRLDLLCLATNRGMQALARRFSAEIEFDYGQVTGILTGQRRTPWSLWHEGIEDSFSYFMVAYSAKTTAWHENSVRSAATL